MKVRPIDPLTRDNPTMALPRASLSAFLATAKATLNTSQHAQPVTFVVGNESAGKDLVTVILSLMICACIYSPIPLLSRAMGWSDKRQISTPYAALSPTPTLEHIRRYRRMYMSL